MSSKAKARTLTDDFEDLEMLDETKLGENRAQIGQEQWARDKNGDLDWAYTARCVRQWSHDALLSHLCDKSFSIPPREYNPSAPFVYVRMMDGEVVTLPHGYRLPLMFVGKYLWETTLSKVTDERTWKAERANLMHLSRLCQNLFRRARVKALKSGMEKGWRCVMFDRLLARFYKHWAANDPKSGPKFVATYSAKEYDRDVLKHDWKRWCLRGLDGVRMTEDEVNNGITVEQFRKTLKKDEQGIWSIDDQPLSFVTTEEGQSSSDLTDYEMDDEQEEDEDDAEHDDDGSEADAEGEEEGEELVIQTVAVAKRPRDEDEAGRSPKRPKVAFPALTRTLAAVSRNIAYAPRPPSVHPPALERSTVIPRDVAASISAQPFASTSKLPATDFTASPSTVRVQPPSKPARTGASSSISAPPIASTPDAEPPAMASQNAQDLTASSASAIYVQPPPARSAPSKPPPREPTRSSTRAVPRPFLGVTNPLAPRAFTSKSTGDGGSSTTKSTIATARVKAPASVTLFSPIHAMARSLKHPNHSMQRHPKAYPKAISELQREPSRSSSSSSPGDEDANGKDMPAHVVTSKALELLVKLVDAKRILGEDPASSLLSSSTATDAVVRENPVQNTESEGHTLESRFHDFEGRFLSVKEELIDIVGRLQVLENGTPGHHEMERKRNERVLIDEGVDCRPMAVSQSIQTDAVSDDQDGDEDVEMGVPATYTNEVGSGAGPVDLKRVFGEIAVQTEQEEPAGPPVVEQQERAIQAGIEASSTSTADVEIQTLEQDIPSIELDTSMTAMTIPSQNGTADSKTELMRSNLSLLIDNLVSVKMLSVMQTITKPRSKDGSVSGADTPTHLASPTTGHPPDSYVVSTLLEELKTMRNEAEVREQREKEEMQAMRQLHSAEVDALRRRLSYLESQNRHTDMIQERASTSSRYRSSSSHSMHFEGGSSHHNHISAPVAGDPIENGRRSRQRYNQPNGHGHFLPAGYGPGESDNASTSNNFSPQLRTSNPPQTDAPDGMNVMPTPTPSEKNYSFTRPGPDMDEDMPLPIKSQRKHHIMAFARAHLG